MDVQITCAKCGDEFQREVKRGRPALKCEKCRGKIAPTPIVETPKKRFKDTPNRGNDRYSRAIIIDLLESGEFDDLLNRYMAEGISKSRAVAKIIKSIGG